MTSVAQDTRVGKIGIGRMGFEMASGLAKGGPNLTVWSRTRARAEPLAACGAKIADRLADLARCDIVFVMGVLQARASGVELTPVNVPVSDGL